MLGGQVSNRKESKREGEPKGGWCVYSEHLKPEGTGNGRNLEDSAIGHRLPVEGRGGGERSKDNIMRASRKKVNQVEREGMRGSLEATHEKEVISKRCAAPIQKRRDWKGRIIKRRVPCTPENGEKGGKPQFCKTSTVGRSPGLSLETKGKGAKRIKRKSGHDQTKLPP